MLNNQRICEQTKMSNLRATEPPSDMGKVFSYNGNGVTMRVKDGTVYVNLTEFARPFPNKNLSTIINSQEIKEYCKALSEIKNFSSVDLLVVTKGGDFTKQGTWAHQKVALRVAQKLSPEFAVWVDTKIEELLTTGQTQLNKLSRKELAMMVIESEEERERLALENEKAKASIQRLEVTIETQAPAANYANAVLLSKESYTSTQMAKELGFRSARALHQELKNRGVMFWQSDQWLLTAKYCGKGYTTTRTRLIYNEHEVITKASTVWTETGRVFLNKMFNRYQTNTAL